MKKLISLLLVAVMALSLSLTAVSADDEIVLKFLISTSTTDFTKDHGYEVCERVAGYKIEYEILNGTEQLMLIISSGQPYDYVYLSGANFRKMMSEEALMDISDLLAEYGNNITEAITTLWPAVTVDGGIYAIPSTAAQPGSLRYSLVARQDLLDAIGWTVDKLPTNTADFKQMLLDIKAAYPDMIPLTASNDTATPALISNIASAFGICAGGNQQAYQLIDGNVVNVIDNPNLEAYIAYVKELYDLELLDAEMPAQKLADARNKWIGNKAVISYNSWNGFAIDTMYEQYENMAFTVLPLLQDENGNVHAQVYSGVGAYGGIPVTAEHPVETIKAINNMMEWNNHLEISLGEEGVHYTKDEEGRFWAVQPAFSEQKNISNVFIAGFYREDIYPTYWEVRLQKNQYMMDCFYAQKASVLDGGERSPVALAPASSVDNQSTLEAKVNDNLLAAICGGSMDKVTEARSYWHANGGEDLTNFYDTWYKANMK